MSAVWLARDDVLDRDVAVKMLHIRRLESAEAVERFEREARTLASLTHPGIVTVIDRGDDHGRPFIVFEYVRGRDLRERIADAGPASARRRPPDRRAGRRRARLRARPRRHPPRREAAQHPADARRPAQADRLRHRARARAAGTHDRGPRPRDGRLPRPGAGGGRAARCACRLSTRSGCVLYHALCGEVPYHSDSYVETARLHAHAPIPSVRDVRPDVPERLDAIVHRALAKRPDDRYPDAGAMRDDLAQSRRRAARALAGRRRDRADAAPGPPAPAGAGLTAGGAAPAGVRARRPAVDPRRAPARAPDRLGRAPDRRPGARAA